MRTCTKCGASKPSGAFYPSHGTKWCRQCFAAYMRTRRAAWTPPDVTPDAKKCGHCGLEKPSRAFGRLIGTSTGLHSWCRSCQAVRAKQRRATNPDAARRIKYGMPVGLYDELSRKQGRACAICRRQRKLVIDHCHATGAIRGLLCKPCNTAIGFFDDSPDIAAVAADYLERAARAKTA